MNFNNKIKKIAKADKNDITQGQAWGYGLLTGFLLSALGFVAAAFLVGLRKCFTQNCFKIFLGMLYALACGALIGDATLHILPDAYINDDTDFKIVTLILIISILFFIILQRVFQSLGVSHKHGVQEDHNYSNHQHHGHQEKVTNDDLKEKLTQKQGQNVKQQSNTWLVNLKGKGTAGYLNILSSFIHNFMDGLGIGISFASLDLNVITPMVAAIVAHQIPRQLGDVGILLKNKFSSIQTIMCNGVVVGLLVGSVDPAFEAYLLVFVAGNFIYIASDIWKHLFRQNMCYNLLQIIMFSFGVGSMYIVLIIQENA